jgi:hypothetical protein
LVVFHCAGLGRGGQAKSSENSGGVGLHDFAKPIIFLHMDFFIRIPSKFLLTAAGGLALLLRFAR